MNVPFDGMTKDEQPGKAREEIAEKPVGEIPEGACALVYSMTFEKRVLREPGISIPLLRERLNAVIEGVIDSKSASVGRVKKQPC